MTCPPLATQTWNTSLCPGDLETPQGGKGPPAASPTMGVFMLPSESLCHQHGDKPFCLHEKPACPLLCVQEASASFVRCLGLYFEVC